MQQDINDTTLIRPILVALEEQMRNNHISKYKLAKMAGLPKTTVLTAFGDRWGRQVEILLKMLQAAGLEVTVRGKRQH